MAKPHPTKWTNHDWQTLDCQTFCIARCWGGSHLVHFFVNHTSYPVAWTSCGLGNDLLSCCKRVFCLLDFLCVALRLLAVLLYSVRTHSTGYRNCTYKLTLKLLDSLFDSRSDSWEDVLSLLECLFLLRRELSLPQESANVCKPTSCLNVYSLLLSPSLASSFLMRSCCCTISLW